MKLNPEDLTAVVDNREQAPLDLAPMQTITGTLATGDYSLVGFEDIIIVERKSLPDLIGCMTSGRERFERELQRMRAYQVRCVVIEATWTDLEIGNYRSQMNPKSATHTVCSWIGKYNVPFQFCESREYAAHFVQQILYQSARQLMTRYQGVIDGMMQEIV